MSVSDAEIAFATELFSGLGPLTTRRMFGGVCLYCEGTMFAVIHSDGILYLKAREDLSPDLEAAGSTRWTHPRAEERKMQMPHWTLPENALDDPDLACEWARRALALL